MEIPDPPERPVCLDCSRALRWLYSARTSRWVAFVVTDPNTLTVHTCSATDRPGWRGIRWEPATPERAELAHRGAARAREHLQAALSGHPIETEETTT